MRRLDAMEKAIREVDNPQTKEEREKVAGAIEEVKHGIRGLTYSGAVEVLSRRIG
ncbi:MAG: hypothetical protein WA982_10920 [Rubrobacteraceae bacterium]